MSRYRLDDQVGYLLRLASQRHAAIFSDHAPEGLTPTQFSTLIRLSEHGPTSQNRLGRLAGMDVATVKGVVDRLMHKDLVSSAPDPADKRRSVISLTDAGRALIPALHKAGRAITGETLAPLGKADTDRLVTLLRRLT